MFCKRSSLRHRHNAAPPPSHTARKRAHTARLCVTPRTQFCSCVNARGLRKLRSALLRIIFLKQHANQS